MRRPATKIIIAAFALGALIVGIAGARLSLRDAPCASGFTRIGTRCCAAKERAIAGVPRCAREVSASCPPPLVTSPRGCDTPEAMVLIPEAKVVIGPSDWEAEGRVPPRTVETRAFRIDAFEVTVGHACSSRALGAAKFCAIDDAARAAYGIRLHEARAYCMERGARLPTEDEWLAAAAGDKPRRYPWGDTGAVCRRAAWGLRTGPCGEGADGPDTAGSHSDGITPQGVHDLAGNVAEWVETGACLEPSEGRPKPCLAVVRGGAWDTALVTELRTWLRREVSADAEEATIGFRCAKSAVD
jgi:formylglycine-generating enzyme